MKLLIFILLSLVFVINLDAQNLKGYVFELNDANEKVPLEGTNVYWEGTAVGASTNENGFFILEKIKSVHSHLIVSYIGYQPDTIEVSSEQDSIEIILLVNRELKEVVVTGTSFSKYFDELDVRSTEIITSNELLKAACCNLSESFTNNASVDIQYQDAVTGARQIQLLGLSGIYTQILFENIPTLKGVTNTFGLSYVPGPWMTAISVSKGAGSVVNGYESITGQINIDYKKPDDLERYYFNAFQSSHYKTDLNANVSIQMSENLSTMLLAHTDFVTKTFDDNFDTFTDQPRVKQFNLMNRWNYYSFDGYDSQFGIQIINEERKGGQITSHDYGIKPGQNYKININTDYYAAYAKNGIVLDEESYTSIALILEGIYHKQNSLFGLRAYDLQQRYFYSNFLFEAKTENEVHSVTTGVSYVFDQYKEEFDSLNYFRKEAVPGLFAEYNFSPDYLISIVPGVRVDFHNIYGTFYTPRLHIKYGFDDFTSLRLSAGKGYRSVNLLAENLNYLASSRKFVVIDQTAYEEGWNYGFNLNRYIPIDNRDLRLTLEFYHTKFLKQTVVDIDSDVRQVQFYNLNGKSYSNNYQVEVYYELLSRLELTAAYRYSDVRTTYAGQLLNKPLTSYYKLLFTGSYATADRDWLFDMSVLVNGNGRVPGTEGNPVEYQRAKIFPSFTNINAQITKKIDFIDIYAGIENILDFTQDNPIIASDDPFGEYFDASLVWGPVDGRKFYLGLRLSVL